MSLPKAFDKELQRAISARAVWLPGEPIRTGDFMVKRDGVFHQAGHISDFGATAEEEPRTDLALDLKSSRATQRVFQFGAEIPTGQLDLTAQATVKLEFKGKSQFMLKTPTLSGTSIRNLVKIARQLAGAPDWKHGNYYIVKQLYSAADWSFLGTKEESTSFELAGKGSAIQSFLDVGGSVGLTTSGTVDVKLLGKGGPVAMNLVRVNKDGSLNHGD